MSLPSSPPAVSSSLRSVGSSAFGSSVSFPDAAAIAAPSPVAPLSDSAVDDGATAATSNGQTSNASVLGPPRRERSLSTADVGDDRLTTIAASFATILRALGEDPTREGLAATPMRAAKALAYFTKGYETDLVDIVNGAIFEERFNEMVIVRDIDIFSLCEHHLVPFTGKLHIGYIPRGKVLGSAPTDRPDRWIDQHRTVAAPPGLIRFPLCAALPLRRIAVWVLCAGSVSWPASRRCSPGQRAPHTAAQWPPHPQHSRPTHPLLLLLLLMMLMMMRAAVVDEVRRLQVQERLTREIAEAIETVIFPLGVGVVIEASHLCMQMRGVEKTSAITVTSSVLGCFQKDARTRQEFFAHIHSHTHR